MSNISEKYNKLNGMVFETFCSVSTHRNNKKIKKIGETKFIHVSSASNEKKKSKSNSSLLYDKNVSNISKFKDNRNNLSINELVKSKSEVINIYEENRRLKKYLAKTNNLENFEKDKPKNVKDCYRRFQRSTKLTNIKYSNLEKFFSLNEIEFFNIICNDCIDFQQIRSIMKKIEKIKKHKKTNFIQPSNSYGIKPKSKITENLNPYSIPENESDDDKNEGRENISTPIKKKIAKLENEREFSPSKYGKTLNARKRSSSTPEKELKKSIHQFIQQKKRIYGNKFLKYSILNDRKQKQKQEVSRRSKKKSNNHFSIKLQNENFQSESTVLKHSYDSVFENEKLNISKSLRMRKRRSSLPYIYQSPKNEENKNSSLINPKKNEKNPKRGMYLL